MHRQLKHLPWFILKGTQYEQTFQASIVADSVGDPYWFSIFYLFAEAPGALTVVVKDQNTDRPLSGVQIVIKNGKLLPSKLSETDELGRVVVEQLDCRPLLG